MIWSDLTWCQIFKLTFQGKKARASNRLDKSNTMAPFSFSYLSYQISYQLKFISLKTIVFHLMTYTAKTVDLMSNLIEKPCRSIERAFQCLFIFRSITVLEKIAIVGEKSLFSQKLNFGDFWWHQYWPDLKITSVKVWDLVAVYLKPFIDCR